MRRPPAAERPRVPRAAPQVFHPFSRGACRGYGAMWSRGRTPGRRPHATTGGCTLTRSRWAPLHRPEVHTAAVRTPRTAGPAASRGGVICQIRSVLIGCVGRGATPLRPLVSAGRFSSLNTRPGFATNNRAGHRLAETAQLCSSSEVCSPRLGGFSLVEMSTGRECRAGLRPLGEGWQWIRRTVNTSRLNECLDHRWTSSQYVTSTSWCTSEKGYAIRHVSPRVETVPESSVGIVRCSAAKPTSSTKSTTSAGSTTVLSLSRCTRVTK